MLHDPLAHMLEEEGAVSSRRARPGGVAVRPLPHLVSKATSTRCKHSIKEEDKTSRSLIFT